MTYELPEPPELKFTLQYNEALITEYGQACYQAGQADAREDLTIAYMAGYSKGRDSMKAECVKEPMDLTQENLERCVAEIKATGTQVLMYPKNKHPWVGLTDDEIMELHSTQYGCGTEQENLLEMGRLVEAKLKEKNT